MSRFLASPLGGALLATAALLLGVSCPPAANGHGGHAGGHAGYHGGAYHGGFYHGGFYHGGFYGGPRFYGYGYRPYYGFYRPYYGFGIGLYGYGYGYGPYLPYYGGYGYGGYGGYGYGGYGGYDDYGGVTAAPASTGGYTTPPADAPAEDAPAASRPPADNAAHLQLIVPEDAKVWFKDTKTTRTGRVREFVTRPLTPGKRYTFKITVRYKDSTGKAVIDARDIHVRANDWFNIDFTRPAPPERPDQPDAPRGPAPVPPGSEE
jgi:uncharacterized protein (TIGR03000 family)